MSAIFHFESLIVVLILFICTCSYSVAQAPTFFERRKEGLLGFVWKASRIGDRLSPYVALFAVAMAFRVLIDSN